jgi:lactoylglutathione lyase
VTPAGSSRAGGPRILGMHHTGFTVSDLERSVAFYCSHLGCEEIARNEPRGGYISELLGQPDAHVRLAQLRHPASEHVLELMEFFSPAPRELGLEPCVVGAGHVCFDVEDLDALHARLSGEGLRFVGAPVRMTAGPNAGGASVYLLDPDGIVVQLRQLPGSGD